MVLTWGISATKGEKTLPYAYNSFYVVLYTWLSSKASTQTGGISVGSAYNLVNITKISLSAIHIWKSVEDVQTGVNWITIGY